MKKPTKAELINYIMEHENFLWEQLQYVKKNFNKDSAEVKAARARWCSYNELKLIIEGKLKF